MDEMNIVKAILYEESEVMTIKRVAKLEIFLTVSCSKKEDRKKDRVLGSSSLFTL